MPELPEVEVTRRQLAPLILGRVVSRVLASPDSRFFLTRSRDLRRRLVGRRLEALERRGKYLLARLDDGSLLLLHLGMTGQLLGVDPAAVAGSSWFGRGRRRATPTVNAHTRLRLEFEDGGVELHFRDARKFGRVQLLSRGQRCARLERLGVDALEATPDDLWRATRGRGISIKSLLLDQSVLAGVGNIYADEALFLARVRPTRRANRTSRTEVGRIAAALRGVLRGAIADGGSSISDYLRPDGDRGRFQSNHRVYGRSGEPCLVCGAGIRRTVIGQRSAHFCPRCQR